MRLSYPELGVFIISLLLACNYFFSIVKLDLHGTFYNAFEINKEIIIDKDIVQLKYGNANISHIVEPRFIHPNNATGAHDKFSSHVPTRESLHHMLDMSDKSATEYFKVIYSDRFLERPGSQVLKGYSVWSSDWHIGPIADFKEFAQKDFKMKVFDKSLSGHCNLRQTCAKDLKVLVVENFGHLTSCERKRFFDAYKNDEKFKAIDYVFCSFPMAVCQAYMPFNKTLIVQSTVRYEAGRETVLQFKQWLHDTKLLMKEGHIIVANNLYDSEYIRYFTGIKVPVLQTFAAYVKNSYYPSRPEILLAPRSKGLADVISSITLAGESTGSKFKFVPVRKLYPSYTYTDIASHRAIVLLPYAVSTISMFEYYRMNIPMFVPSVDLLYDWHRKSNLFNERTWPGTRGKPPRGSLLPKHIDAGDIPYDPNNEFNDAAWKYWVSFSDFYQWPFIVQFSSINDLIKKLDVADFNEISLNMSIHNIRLRNDQLRDWEKLLMKSAKLHPPGTRRMPQSDYYTAMYSLYGEMPEKCNL